MSSTQIHHIQSRTSLDDTLVSNSFSSGSMTGFSIMQAQHSFNSPTDHSTYWQGSSEQFHPIDEVPVDDFILNETKLYMLVSKDRAIWIGTARDLIEDSASRSLFRHSTKFASAAYQLDIPKDEAKRISLVADLMSGHPAQKLHAA